MTALLIAAGVTVTRARTGERIYSESFPTREDAMRAAGTLTERLDLFDVPGEYRVDVGFVVRVEH